MSLTPTDYDRGYQDGFQAARAAAPDDAKDAARYRWLRSSLLDIDWEPTGHLGEAETQEEFDAAIDAELAKEKK